MAQLITVRLNKADHQPLGFRLQGGKDFGTPLVVQKVNGGSAAERAGLQAGDALIRVNTTEVYALRHQEAQDAIRASGPTLELTVQRGGSTWRPAVTPTGSLPRPGSRPLGATPTPVTNTSLKATPQPSRAFGSGHNNVAKPFGYMNGNDSVKSIVNKQYNTPVNMYSDKTIAETLSAQTEVLAGGVLGVNFKKNEKTYDAEKSAVFKVLQEEENDPEPEVSTAAPAPPVSGLRHVQAPVTRPDAPVNNTGGLPPGQNICEECERLITGVFVRIKDKNLHVECFKCSTCGTSLKNQGYYNLNGKLYCDIHAKLVARQNPPAPNLDPVTVPPGARIPTNTYSTPLPPIATGNYTNGSSSLFSPSSNLSGPKPFGSSMGSAYSPSLSPRSAPLSPARPVAAPAPAPAPAPLLANAPAPPPSSFAPSQNVKSIVWPPPNPPEDEPPKYESTPNVTNIKFEDPSRTLLPARRADYNPGVQVFDKQQQSIKQYSSVQQEQYSSSASYSSAAMSSVKSESIQQHTHSQTMQQTTSRLTTTVAEESATSQSYVYQGEESSQGILDKRVEDNTSISDTKQNEMELKTEPNTVVELQEKTKDENDKAGTTESKDTSTSSEKNYHQSNPSDDGDITKIAQQIKVEQFEKIESNTKQKTEYIEAKSSPNPNINITDNKENNPVNLEKTALGIDVPKSLGQTSSGSMVEALTIAPERPYSPLPSPQPVNLLLTQTRVEDNKYAEETQNITEKETQDESYTEAEIDSEECAMPTDQIEIPEPSPIFTQQPKREITPIPPLKVYNPPEKSEAPVPMPPETNPYIPPDFKITVEPQSPLFVPRDSSCSPMIEALTTVPDRPFTPKIHVTPMRAHTIERGSLREALTIAPDRPFSPLPINITSQSNHYTATTTVQTHSVSSEIFKPIATQSINQITDLNESQVSNNIQNTYELQSSSQTSAFKPVSKQIFSPPNPHEFNIPPMQTKYTMPSEATSLHQSNFAHNYLRHQGFSTVKATQHYFEELDRKESLSSTAIRSKSGLQKPDRIPPYQKNFEMLPSQRGISPDMYREKPIPQRPVTPSTDPPMKRQDKSQERYIPTTTIRDVPEFNPPQIRTTIEKAPPSQSYLPVHKENPISMTFQPVSEGNFMRVSPIRSRPSTPSLINKPAPIIPHYQMNLVPVEHLAPETHLYEAPSREGSRSPTPKPRSRSPAPGPPPNPLKAQAPRIKEATPQAYLQQSYLPQNTIGLRKDNEIMQKPMQGDSEYYNAYATRLATQDQNSMFNEQRFGNVGYKTESYAKGDMNVKEDSLTSQQYDQRQMQSQNIAEYGNKTVQTTRKTFEEFERMQSAKVVEIRKGSSSSFGGYQLPQPIESSNVSANLIYPPPALSFSTPQTTSSFSSSINHTNDNIATASRKVENYQPTPSSSGANQGPVCDPTPSAGSSVGAAARGKTFGVSSAPKRGRGILNKPALPGSRVPLCASCNGNISCVFLIFLTANEMQSPSMPHKTEFKSQAEERLIRKMAKMALNGYEIGIQRKIKPADHIQSMADKIQDTVVTKHPLNTDGLSSGENSRDNTLKKVNKKIIDPNYKTSDVITCLGDRIKDTIVLNHPTNINLTENIAPIPPPLPTTPIPTTNIYNTSIEFSPNLDNAKKTQDTVPRKLSNTFAPNIQIGNNLDKLQNGSDSNSSLDESTKDKCENNFLHTLRKKNDSDKSVFLNDMNTSNPDIREAELRFDYNNHLNTLNKRKLFEKIEQMNSSNISDSGSKIDDKITFPETNLRNKANLFEQNIVGDDEKNKTNQDDETAKNNKSLSNNLHDNSLYCFKAVKADEKHDEQTKNELFNTTLKKDLTTDNEKQENSEAETVVKRRQKKSNRNDDGRRDSHIIARPLSTMTSVDVADGQYPVCHKCDKAIKRGPFITALGRIWCPEHFICVNATCRRPLQDIGFVEENGQLYCEFCFEQYIAPSCDKCHAKIKGDCLNAIGKHFHPECFSCVYCGKLFGNNPFFLEDGLPYCEADWNELFTTKCFACGFPVEAGDRWVEALNNNYHSQCFNCTVCKKNLEGQSFFAKGGRPFCKSHAR